MKEENWKLNMYFWFAGWIVLEAFSARTDFWFLGWLAAACAFFTGYCYRAQKDNEEK